MPGRLNDPTLQKGRRLAALLHAFMRGVRMTSPTAGSRLTGPRERVHVNESGSLVGRGGSVAGWGS